jgi:hypothetical protein
MSLFHVPEPVEGVGEAGHARRAESSQDLVAGTIEVGVEGETCLVAESFASTGLAHGSQLHESHEIHRPEAGAENTRLTRRLQRRRRIVDRADNPIEDRAPGSRDR